MTGKSAAGTSNALDRCRLIGLAILFVGLPLWMVPHTRAAPAFLGYFSLLLLVGHSLTRFARVDHAYLALLRKPAAWSPFARTGALLLACLIAWTALALYWAPDLEQGLDEVIWVLAAVPACAILIVPEMRRAPSGTLWTVIALGSLFGAAFVLSELVGWTGFHTLIEPQARLYDLNRNAGFLGLILWVLLLMPFRNTRAFILAGLSGIAVMATIFFSQSQSAQMALMASMLAAAGIYLLPRLVLPGYAVMAALVIAMPLLTHPAVSPDVTRLADGRTIHFLKEAHFDHRLALWQGYAEKVGERPIAGWGAGADKVMGLDGEIGQFAAAAGYPPKATNPHNAPLEIWVNYGAVGAMLSSALILWAGFFNAGLAGRNRIAFCALVVSVFAYSLTASSFFQAWWIGSIAATFSAFMALAFNKRTTRH